jgi:hypothetical protein
MTLCGHRASHEALCSAVENERLASDINKDDPERQTIDEIACHGAHGSLSRDLRLKPNSPAEMRRDLWRRTRGPTRQKNAGNPRARTWAHCVAKRCRPQI